ncbi:BtpA/SgcQ family protein [Aureimonas populi]|uniref:BtpA/SgcQ family protein n=1 Tax=Aureimonas populi TaxID=1701758 RepID=A0ABW5CQS1_9HYPH|nr:BtpA/SgcQ family protein [Aureimonas populi]
MPSQKLFQETPQVIAALHLPDFAQNRHRSLSWYEDYVVANATIFAKAGIPWLKLQDTTRTAGGASPETLAMTAALGRLLRREVPQIGMGIIVDAHDPLAALAIAHAAGADFVRLKVFVGGAMTAQGPRYGLGAEAVQYRAVLERTDIAILADVHDRTAVPMSSESQVFAAEWACKSGADGLIITGDSFPDSLHRIAAVRDRGLARPILIGGSVTAHNVAEALTVADGAIVSTALMRRDAGEGEIVKWDLDLCHRFMEAARGASSTERKPFRATA